jgi:succinate dehydrogenase / fumarate reductase cytochrome b subunit
MLVSILHRVTGAGLSIVGGIALVWWLTAAATGRGAYESFADHADNWYGVVIGVGLTWALFQHTLSGIRHLVLDMGAGYELSTNKRWALMTVIGSSVLTLLFWLYILEIR